MLQLVGCLIVQCNSCGTEHTMQPEVDLDGDSFFLEEGNMGERIEHDRYGELECDRCGNPMSFKLIGYEYPPGALDYSKHVSKGCMVLEQPLWVADYDYPAEILTVYQQVLWGLRDINDLTPHEFEELVAEIFRRNGMETHVTSQTRDGGKDIVAEFEKGGIRYTTYFECKHWSTPVGVSVIRALAGVINRDRANKGVIVTDSYFTRDAHKEATMHNGRIQLIDRDKLQELIHGCELDGATQP